MRTAAIPVLPRERVRCDACRFRCEHHEILSGRPLAYCMVRSFRPCADVNRDGTCTRFVGHRTPLVRAGAEISFLAWSVAAALVLCVAMLLAHAL